MHSKMVMKGHDAEGPPIALGAPKLERPRGFFPPRYMASPPLYTDFLQIYEKKFSLTCERKFPVFCWTVLFALGPQPYD
jgi:hypothetical protein